jgi:excisionase family DNA binding protein
MAEKTEKPLDIQGAAEFLGYSKGYIYQLVNEKRLPHHKPFGGKLYFFASELSETIARAKRSAGYEIADKADAILNGGGAR